MNIKIIKLTTSVVACLTALSLLNSCNSIKRTFQSEAVVQDCSSIFETRYVNNEQKTSFNKKENKNLPKTTIKAENEASKVITECKILEVKLDNNLKCEIVGSDKIDSLSKVISENKDEKIVLIAPTNKLRDISKLANKYLASNGVDIKKYLDLDIFKNLAFPYKGMRCAVADKKFVVWEGKNQVILTIQNK